VADYQARINLLVTGQNRLRDVQTQLQAIEQTITDLERRQRVAGAAASRTSTIARAIGGTAQPRGQGGRFVADPDRQQRFAVLAAQRRLDVETRLARLLTSRARDEATGINTRIAAQSRLNRRVEDQIALESRLNAAVDLYRTNLRKFERGGSGRQDATLAQNAAAIQEAFAAFEAGGSRNLNLVRALATELGRVGEAQRELNRAQSLGSKGFEAGRRLQERLSAVAEAGTTSPERIRAARSMATEVINASRGGDQQAYTEALRSATAATSRLERESRETAAALQAQQTEIARAAAATAQVREAESAASAAARNRLAAAAQVRQERATFLAGAPVSQFPTGPNPRSTRGRFEGDTSVERAESALRARELTGQLEDDLKRVQDLRVKGNNQRAQFFAQEKAEFAVLEKKREDSAKAQARRIQNLGKAVRGSLSSAAIGGAFPLLFGQSPQAAVGGAIGGLLGGAGGGFAGSLLGTALGELEAAKARTKELALELGLTSTQAKTLATAFELAGRNSQQLEAAVTNIQGLGLSTQETASAIKIAVELSKEYGGSVEKIAQAFADTLESGKVSVSTLNKFTAQGIPIQDQLAEKLGVSRTKLLEMAKDGKISVQQVTDVLVDMGQEAEKTADKGKTGFDRFVKAVEGIATAIAGAAGAILKNLVPALDTVLTKLSNIITRATQALSLIADAQVGEASAALARSGMARGTLFGVFTNKGNIDDLAQGLKSLQPLSAKTKEQFDRIADVAQRYRIELSQYGDTLGEYAVETAQVELTRVEKDLAVARKLVGAPARPDAITDITAPADLSPSGGGGKSAADKAAKEANRIAEQIRTSKLQLALAQNIFAIEGRLQQAQLEGNEQLVLARNAQKELAQIASQRADIIADKEIPALAKKNVLNKLAIDAATVSGKLGFDLAKIEQDRTESFDVIIADLNLELELKTATTEQAREQLRLEAEIAKIRGDKSLTDPQKDEIERRKRELAAPKTEGQKINAELGAVEDELKTLVSLSNQVTSAANAIGTAFGNSFKGLISGSMTAKEALASFFQSVADHFLDMAAKIIAKMIQMFILQQALKIFGGALGGGGLSNLSAPANINNPLGELGNIGGAYAFAEGGFVTGPTNAIIGEGGESEYVIPSSKMNAAMSRYSRGARGEGVIAGSGGGTEGESGAATAGPMVVDVRYSVERINDVEYVTASQFQAGMQQAAQQGAQQGEQRTLRKLQMSNSTRRRVGV
jgi:tape measure domain-containing protein